MKAPAIKHIVWVRSLRLAAALFALPLCAQVQPTAEQQRPYSHKVHDDLKLSLDVGVDDPDRIIVWLDDKPVVVERGRDDVKWAGDPKYWSDGDFVESSFPKEYPPGTPGVNIRCSKHIRIIYGNHAQMTEDYVRGNLRMFEECLKLYYVKLGFPVPFEARDPAKRDGRKYKVDVLVGGSDLPPHKGSAMFTAGGCWGCYDGERTIGYLMCGPASMRHTPPSGATPHELAHACQMHCNVHSPGSGFWWEAHANWMMLQFINTYPAAINIADKSEFYWGHGRHYYDCWQIFEHLKDEPGFGYDFVTRLWRDGEDMEYIWKKAEKLAAPRSMADEWGKMARRNVTWDYARRDIFIKQDKPDDNRLRNGFVLLEPSLSQPGWQRVPWHVAPQQFGYNICPLKPTSRNVAVDFSGFANPARGSDWRVSLVAVNAERRPHYSEMWSGGKKTFALHADDAELYLVVSATPRVMELVPETDYRGLEKERFPYQVKLEGAEPLDLLAGRDEAKDETVKPVAGRPHANGGGFVADGAKVDAGAFVGPAAMVLGRAQVLGNARITDFAVVKDEAVVKDHAVVSGHARIENRGRVEENAHIADYGVVKENAVVNGYARIIERGVAMAAVRVGDFATHKGRAVSWGERTAGTATLDGDYANALNVAKGTWFHWFVNKQESVDNAPDTRGMTAQYSFDRAHPFYAWDTFGETHGLVVGNPEIRREPTGRTEPVADIVDSVGRLEFGDIGKDNWGALTRGHLHPPAAGDYTFLIASDNESEFWLSTDESPANKRKICEVTGGWTGRDDFNRFPGQKSKPVRLDPSKTYYFEALHKERDGLELLQVAWEAPGLQRKVVGGDAISSEPRGPRGRVKRQVWLDIPGGAVKDLTSSPKYKPEAAKPIERPSLVLNGRDQFVALRRDIAFRAHFSAELLVQRDDTSAEAVIFEFFSLTGDNRLALLIGANGKPRLVVRRDGREVSLESPAALGASQTGLSVSLGDGGAAMLISGKLVAENPDMVVRPWDLGLDAGFLGRGKSGGYLKGSLAEVNFYCVPIFDRSPPQPNPPAWQLKPTLINARTVTMRAVPGRKPMGGVEYRFTETSRAFDSGWIKSPECTVGDLLPGRQFNVVFGMRDDAGNTGKASEIARVATPAREHPAFHFAGDICRLRAVDFHDRFETAISPWREVKRADFPDGPGIEVPDTGHTADALAVASAEAPRLDYRVNFPKAGKYFATVRCWAPHNGNNLFFAGADFTAKPKKIEFQPGKPVWCDRIELEIPTPGTHVFHLWMGRDGAQFDAICISPDAGKLPGRN